MIIIVIILIGVSAIRRGSMKCIGRPKARCQSNETSSTHIIIVMAGDRLHELTIKRTYK